MQGLLDLLLVLSLNGFDECLGGHRAVNQGLEAGDNGAGLHTCGGVVDVVGGVTGLHQTFVGGKDLAEKLVIGARSLAFADRRVAVVNCDLAGFVGLEEVEEGGCSVLVLGVGRDTESGHGVGCGRTGIGLFAGEGDPAGVIAKCIVDGGGVPAAGGEEQGFAVAEAAQCSGTVKGERASEEK